MSESEVIPEISVHDTAQLGYCITGIVYLLLPAAAYYVLRRYGAARLIPVIAGAVMYFIATRFADLTIRIALGSASFALMSVAAAELVPFFEEPARFLAMKYPLTGINTAGAAVSYGIGHAGLECVFRAVDSFRQIGILDRLASGGAGQFISGASDETAARITENLRRIADYSFPVSITASVSLIMSFGLHIALSLLIYKKLHDQKPVKWLFAAVGIHYLNNCLGWAVSFIGIRPVEYILSSASTFILILLTMNIIGGKAVLEEVTDPPYSEYSM